MRRDSQDKNTQDMPKRSEGVISSPERLPRDSKPSISTIDKGKNRLEPAKGTAQHSTARGECSDESGVAHAVQEQVVYHLMAVCRVCPAFDSS